MRIAALAERLAGTQRRRVKIVSPGGTFAFFSRMAPAIERTGFTSIGCDVRSAAIILHLLGARRYATRDAVFFFHEVRAISHDTGDEIMICDLELALDMARDRHSHVRGARRESVEEALLRLKNDQWWMMKFAAERTGVHGSTFLNLMRSEATLNANDALRYGLIHRIVSEDELRGNPSL